MIPDTLRIRNRKWKIERLDNEYLIYDGKRCRGFTCVDTRTIELCSKLGSRTALVTLVHECVHAIGHEYDLKIPHKLIYAMEKPLADVIITLATQWRKTNA